MFESHYVCHFFRLWGYEEGKKGIQLQNALLGNMQNDFDSKFGDVCAEVNTRYFIIEFKRERKNFREEVSPSGKFHRSNLYNHLRIDSRCRSIARQGHLGAYADDNDQLIFEPYAHCVAEVKPREKIIQETLNSKVATWHELDYRSYFFDFKKFYNLITVDDCNLSEFTPGFFKNGLGITKEHLEDYIYCMYQHLSTAKDESGAAILGAFSPKDGKFVAFNGTINDLISRLHYFFNKIKSSQSYGSAPSKGF